MNSGVTFRRFHFARSIAGALLPRLLIVFLLPCMLFAQDSASQKKRQAAQADETYTKGISALQQGDLATAQAAFEKVVRMAPNSAEGHNSLGWVFLAQEQIDSAIRQFPAAVRLMPNFVQPTLKLATALLLTADVHGVLRYSRVTSLMRPEHSHGP